MARGKKDTRGLPGWCHVLHKSFHIPVFFLLCVATTVSAFRSYRLPNQRASAADTSPSPCSGDVDTLKDRCRRGNNMSHEGHYWIIFRRAETEKLTSLIFISPRDDDRVLTHQMHSVLPAPPPLGTQKKASKEL